MSKMCVAQVTRPNGPLEIVEREIPDPKTGQVRIKIQACGICHSDSVTKEGIWPGIEYPRVPGHEIAGRIDALGSSVAVGHGVNESESAGTVDTAATATPVVAAISLPAKWRRKFQAFHTTAATPNTCSLPQEPWR
jgi:Zn-dependent alcohol dehydrogenase